MKIKLFTIPNLLTLLNLFCGSLAIVFALRFDDLRLAFVFVLVAALFDFLDGFVARLTNSYSEVGKQLDSLADVVSFGLAPAVVLYMLYIYEGGLEWGVVGAFGAYVPFILALFSALRLAKFNIDESQSEEFVGMPTPAVAILVASVGYLYAEGMFSVAPIWILIATIVLSWLLISPIRMFALKFKNFSFKGNELRYIFLLASVVSIIVLKIVAVPLIIIAYVIVSTIRHLLFQYRGSK